MRIARQTEPQSGAPEGTGQGFLGALRTFESLKVRDYRYYLASSMAQMAGMNMQWVAGGWFLYKLTGSMGLLGFSMLLGAVPQLTLSFLGGTVADRVPRKLVLIAGLLVSSLMSLWIALSTSLGIITWHYLVVSFLLQGAIMSLVMPSRQAIISELVGRDRLMNAVALNTSVMNVNQIGAPAIAGFVVAWVGIEWVYYLMTLLYLVALLLLLPMKQAHPKNLQGTSRRGVLGDIKDGLTYVRRNQTLLTLLVLSLLTFVLSMPFRMLLPVFTEDILKVGPEKLGILTSVSGAGALVGSLVIASLGSKGRGMLFLHTGLLTGLSIVAFSISTSYLWSLAIMVVAGVGQSGRMALSNTLLQSYTEDAYLGRVMSLHMMQGGLTSIGVFGVSIAAEFIGIQWAVGITAALLILITFYYYIFSPLIRRLE